MVPLPPSASTIIRPLITVIISIRGGIKLAETHPEVVPPEEPDGGPKAKIMPTLRGLEPPEVPKGDKGFGRLGPVRIEEEPDAGIHVRVDAEANLLHKLTNRSVPEPRNKGMRPVR